MPLDAFDQELLDAAYEQAQAGLAEGGIPIGAALGNRSLGIVARGRNRRVQDGDTTAHGETSCIRNAGRRRDWHTLTLATTLSPCIMCSGTALLFRIPRIIIAERTNFRGAEELLISRGVDLIHAADERCETMMRTWIEAHDELWNEDIGVPDDASREDG